MITQPSYQTYLDAKALLMEGELVAFPTETVYGLGANALDESAVNKIFQTKGRPQKNPIIVHVGSVEQIAEYAEISNAIEQTIIDKLMPGPLTLLLKKKSTIPSIVTAGSEFVGIRIPSNQVANDFLKIVQLPIAAPSANISTKPSPTTANMVWDNFRDKLPMIIDGGNCEVGIESTVVKVEENRIIITRPGYISQEDIQLLFPPRIGEKPVIVEYAQTASEITPGNMFKHYAPHARVHIISNLSDISPSLKERGLGGEETSKSDRGLGGEESKTTSALIATTEFLSTHKITLEKEYPHLEILPRGTHENMITCAHNLFSLYHQCDQKKYSQIYIESLPEKGIGYAIMNRVRKSAEQ